MTDITNSVSTLLMVAALVGPILRQRLTVTKAAFGAAIGINFLHTFDIMIVAPVSSDTNEAIGWASLALVIFMMLFLAGRGLIDFARATA